GRRELPALRLRKHSNSRLAQFPIPPKLRIELLVRPSALECRHVEARLLSTRFHSRRSPRGRQFRGRAHHRGGERHAVVRQWTASARAARAEAAAYSLNDSSAA